ncbi:uridine phosphorylase [Insulibacter thermoxylanivorax]|uniref:Uridine phosphorylase n=1 Tax=Insulibacter thermoxylanivorax TaxID=2749268 RepID=A0A916QAB6_9BACL|nr:nucleoside phosphorylase [Insulibacter thermoxylanivorax]GFR37035.1 uridine phosphorylase [Insulibacter thermoxylanivorax]
MFLPVLKLNSEDLPDRAVVCGDPGRAKLIADRMEDAKELAYNREYRTFVGTYQGVCIAVVSHGVGCPGAAVCFEELIRGGVKTLIRVGTAGSYTQDLPPGSLVVSTAAVRTDGLTAQLVPEGFPAVADPELALALYNQASQVEGINTAKGITLTLDVFYNGVVEFPHKLYKQAGVLAVEMEISALYTIASLRGAKAAAIVATDGYADADLADVYDPYTDAVSKAVEAEMDIALRTLASL